MIAVQTSAGLAFGAVYQVERDTLVFEIDKVVSPGEVLSWRIELSGRAATVMGSMEIRKVQRRGSEAPMVHARIRGIAPEDADRFDSWLKDRAAGGTSVEETEITGGVLDFSSRMGGARESQTQLVMDRINERRQRRRQMRDVMPGEDEPDPYGLSAEADPGTDSEAGMRGREQVRHALAHSEVLPLPEPTSLAPIAPSAPSGGEEPPPASAPLALVPEDRWSESGEHLSWLDDGPRLDPTPWRRGAHDPPLSADAEPLSTPADPPEPAPAPPSTETLPSETLPSETLPSETLPSETLPSETLPSETLPSETLTSEPGPPEVSPPDVEVEPSEPTAELEAPEPWAEDLIGEEAIAEEPAEEDPVEEEADSEEPVAEEPASEDEPAIESPPAQPAPSPQPPRSVRPRPRTRVAPRPRQVATPPSRADRSLPIGALSTGSLFLALQTKDLAQRALHLDGPRLRVRVQPQPSLSSGDTLLLVIQTPAMSFIQLPATVMRSDGRRVTIEANVGDPATRELLRKASG